MNSSFARRFALTAGMIILNTLLLALSFTGLYYSYMVREEKKELSSNAAAVSSYAGTYTSLSDITDWDLQIVITYGATASGTDVLICDDTGTVQQCTCDQIFCSHLGTVLPYSILQPVSEDGYAYTRGVLDGIYEDDRFLYAEAITSVQDDSFLGYVVVSSVRSDMDDMVTRIVYLFALAALSCLVLALFITLLITRRQTETLREISSAARQFAHGDFSARINAEGADEETSELATAFNNMANSLEKQEALRQEFISNVSHELKTPMTTIAGFMDGMLDGTIPPERYSYYMSSVSSEVKRLNRMVRSMLDISRMNATSESVVKSRFDVTETLGRTLLTFEQKIEAKHLDVEVNMPDRAVYVLANEDNITQVIYNLIDNAVKFAREASPLQLAVESSGGKALISVANTGTTIPAEELPLVFDRFHKSDKSRSMDTSGVGLGLYIVKTILGSHGEDITVTSENEITTFTFTLELDR